MKGLPNVLKKGKIRVDVSSSLRCSYGKTLKYKK